MLQQKDPDTPISILVRISTSIGKVPTFGKAVHLELDTVLQNPLQEQTTFDFFMTTQQARDLAADLLRGADEADKLP